MPFLFENLEVYKRSLNLIEKIEDPCTVLKGKSSFSILDQLTRASLSIPLNIAEGNGRWHLKDKMQFFRIARGSVFEIVPILQILDRKGMLASDTYNNCYEELQVIAKMLTALIKSIEDKNE